MERVRGGRDLLGLGLSERGIGHVSFGDWGRLDEAEDVPVRIADVKLDAVGYMAERHREWDALRGQAGRKGLCILHDHPGVDVLDVLVAAPAGSARAAKNLTHTLPIVFMGEPDPVGTRLVASLARPGGSVTGLADAHADLIPKRLELLKQVTPLATRVGVLRNAANTPSAAW